MKKLLALLLLILPGVPLAAPDQNGYEAKYECRAGNSNCNIDVVSLVGQACQQTITTADSISTINSKINGGSQFICVEPGDYTGKGTFSVTASGSTSAYKVLRYNRGGDTNDEPWNQTDGNKAKVRTLNVSGGDFWIIHRLTIPGTTSSPGSNPDRLFLQNGADNIIINRVLVEGRPTADGTSFYSAIGSGWVGTASSNLTVQNSVIRTNYTGAQNNCVGLAFEGGTNVRLVNNEIYDWCEHNIQPGNNGGPTMAGFVLENNDVYYNSAFSGYAEGSMDIKAEGTLSNPMLIIQNRAWGGRPGNANLCCGGPGQGGGGGHAFNVSDGSPLSYIALKNNILFDNTTAGLGTAGFFTSTNWSIIGNIFWNNNRHSVEVYSVNSSEFYLNTFLSPNLAFDGGGSSCEYRCNVHFGTGMGIAISPSTSFTTNVFYSATSRGTNTLNRSMVTRANSTAYAVGDVIRLSSNPNVSCTSTTDSDCFLYKVTTAGTSAGSLPSYCTLLGCTQVDGGVTLRAFRGPFQFFRKLRTAPEAVVIPYVRTHAQSPDFQFCPGQGETSALGSTTGIGINDSVLGQSGTDFWNSIVGPR